MSKLIDVQKLVATHVFISRFTEVIVLVCEYDPVFVLLLQWVIEADCLFLLYNNYRFLDVQRFLWKFSYHLCFHKENPN